MPSRPPFFSYTTGIGARLTWLKRFVDNSDDSPSSTGTSASKPAARAPGGTYTEGTDFGWWAAERCIQSTDRSPASPSSSTAGSRPWSTRRSPSSPKKGRSDTPSCLLALSVEVGLGVLGELLEEEVEQLVGPKGRWNPDRTAVRHGHEDGEVTLGGRRVAVKRPRVRTADGESEISLRTYEHFADRDLLGRAALERMLAGVSTASTGAARSPSEVRRRRGSGRHRSRRSRARSCSAPAKRCGI